MARLTFVKFVEKIIADEKMQNLSSDGWKRMRQVERELDAGTIDLEAAIDRFLAERDGDYGYNLRKKYKMEDYLKMFKK